MDPKANITEQLQLAAEITRLGDMRTNDAFANECAETDIAIAGMRLAELVIALDKWRKKGGHELAQKLTPCVVICNLRRPLLARLDYHCLSLRELETLQWLNRILARLEER